MKKAILYINQFFFFFGGEDPADFVPAIREVKIGLALEYAKILTCGNYTYYYLRR